MDIKKEQERLKARKLNLDKRIAEKMNTPTNTRPGVEFAPVNGNLTVLKKFNDGSEEVVFNDPNTITDFGRESFTRLISTNYASGLDVNDTRPSGIVLGSGTIAEGSRPSATNLSAEITASGGGETLSSFWWKSSSTGTGSELFDNSDITVVNGQDLQIETTLSDEVWLPGGSSYATSNVSEAGLFSYNNAAASPHTGRMIAYKVFPSALTYNPAETNFSLLFRWTISFANPA